MINVKIYTPEGVVYETIKADHIMLPTKKGIAGIYPDHRPMISLLVAGEIEVIENGKNKHFAVSSGVVNVEKGNVVNIIADTAENAENIDLERAEEALKRANEYMTTTSEIQDTEYAAMQGRIEKELARVNVALKYMKMRKRINRNTQNSSSK